jgi:hypothetical protein
MAFLPMKTPCVHSCCSNLNGKECLPTTIPNIQTIVSHWNYFLLNLAAVNQLSEWWLCAYFAETPSGDLLDQYQVHNIFCLDKNHFIG